MNVCVWDRPERFHKGTRKSHCRPNRVHAVSLCVIGGVIESAWLSEVVGGRHGHICGYWASCIDPGPDSRGGGGGEGGPDEKRWRLITVSTDPGMLT